MAEGVALLRDVPRTTKPVEEQHGSMAIMHRGHGSLCGPQLSTRAYLHSLRGMAARDPMLNTLERHQRSLDGIERKKPGRVSGYHMFVGESIEESQRTLSPGGRLSSNDARRVLSDAGWRWRSLAPELRSKYEAEAKHHAKGRTADQFDDAQHVRDAMDLFLHRHQEEAIARGQQYRIAEVRLSDGDMLAIVGRMQTQPKSRQAQAKLRKTRTDSVFTPLLFDQRDILDRVLPDADTGEAGDITDFVRIIARFRDLFRHSILLLEGDPQGQAFVFLFATQVPLRAYFGLAKMAFAEVP